MPTIKDVTSAIESVAPLSYQESYDNAGLLTGNHTDEATGAVLCVDVTDAVIDEAIECGANLIVSHHPLVFSPLKTFTGKSRAESLLVKAIQNKIALYAAHTNLDSCAGGISHRLAEMLGLENISVLSPRGGNLLKLVVFVPDAHAASVADAMFSAGAGTVGNYDCCSFSTEGVGTFRAGEGTNPFVGEHGKIHAEPERRLETIVKKEDLRAVLSSMIAAHPYEEVAYDIIPLANRDATSGFGAVGEFSEALTPVEFFKKLRATFNLDVIRHTNPCRDSVKKVAICSGSGSSMLGDAVASGADAYMTADIKYDGFFDAEERIILADIGHFESEYCAIDILYDIVTKKISNFAVRKSKMSANPICYFRE